MPIISCDKIIKDISTGEIISIRCVPPQDKLKKLLKNGKLGNEMLSEYRKLTSADGYARVIQNRYKIYKEQEYYQMKLNESILNLENMKKPCSNFHEEERSLTKEEFRKTGIHPIISLFK